MKIARNVAEVLDAHTTLAVECIDRMYLNAYVPILQTSGGIAHFFRNVHDKPVASSVLMAPYTERFVAAINRFAHDEGIDLITFERGERKEDRAQAYLRAGSSAERVLFIGKAQEKARVHRTERHHNPHTDTYYASLYPSTAYVNHYYFYALDDDFGPFFLKVCSYFPFNARLCLNGHEYVKRQLTKRGIAFAALDNGIARCAEPALLQRLCDEITPTRIEGLLQKWLARLPAAFLAEDRAAGINYQLSILQAEFALTQVFDRPAQGRVFFEEVIRENLDLGRPHHVQLIFNRRVQKNTPSRFRTRVITDGVVPTLHIDYKHSRIKQYYKEGRALRTETTINDAYDFHIGRRLCNLEDLKSIGFTANRRLLRVQRISHDCTIGIDAFDAMHKPKVVAQQRASSLRFGDPRVQALLAALLAFRLMPQGFSNRQLREHVAPLLGTSIDAYAQGRMTYDLRRLRLHGLIERIPRSHRYAVTERGLVTALCYHRTYARVLRPAFSTALDNQPQPTRFNQAIRRIDHELQRLWEGHTLAA